MKRLAISSLLVTVLSSSVLAQDSTTTFFGQKNAIGINASDILGRFFSYFPVQSEPYPYLVTYRRFIGDNAIRVGMGGSFDTSNGTENDSVFTSYNTSDFTVGIGYERLVGLGDRWSTFFGVDAVYNQFKSGNTIESDANGEFLVSESTETRWGAHPLLGIIFNLGDRIQLSTETRFELDYVRSTYFYDFQSPVPRTVDREGTGLQASFNTPTSISFRILF